MSKTGEWMVRVVKINPENKTALCSWNGNSPRTYNEKQLLKLRITRKVRE